MRLLHHCTPGAFRHERMHQHILHCTHAIASRCVTAEVVVDAAAKAQVHVDLQQTWQTKAPLVSADLRRAACACISHCKCLQRAQHNTAYNEGDVAQLLLRIVHLAHLFFYLLQGQPWYI